MGERPRTWQQAERRALVADLVRTQRTLQARSEQLQEIFASRWYRLARFFWRLRSGSVFRRSSPPRLADEGSFARALNGDATAREEPEVRLVPAPSSGIAVDLERQRWLAGAHVPGLEELRVAAILDEATEACLAPECDLNTEFGTGDWRDRLEAEPPHLLLVESAWAGNGGGWTGAVSPHPGSPQAQLPALRELVAWCRERDIPSAFWATRDPFGFDRFAEAAALFDHVFTVDADCMAAYRRLSGTAARTIGALPLAAQPRLHNPVGGSGERLAEPAFAGAFDRSRPREQLDELIELLDAAAPFDLAIYECGSAGGGEEGAFPTRFLPCVRGRLPYAEKAAVYKRHHVFLNAGPASASPTALPRQVFELLACDTAVLSTPSAGIEEIFGDMVTIAGDGEQAAEQLERLLGDRGRRRGQAARARRHVLGAHTYRDRLAELVAAVGFDLPPSAGEETAVLIVAHQDEDLGEAVDSLLGQSLAPDEVLFGLAPGATVGREFDHLAERFPEARIRTMSQDGEALPSERTRELARLASAPWVAPMAPTLRYGPHHLRDLVACTRFAEAQVIGYGEATGRGAHRYTEGVVPHAALAARALVAERGWPRDEVAMRRWFARGVRIYAGEDSGSAEGAG